MSEENSNAPAQTAKTSNRNTQNRNQGNRNNNNRRFNNRTIISSPINFEGETGDIGVVIGLRIETFHKKAGYQFFCRESWQLCSKKVDRWS